MGGYHFIEMIKGVPKRIRIPTLGCVSLQRHEQKCHCGNRRSAASGGCSKAISRMCPDFHDTKWLKIVCTTVQTGPQSGCDDPHSP